MAATVVETPQAVPQLMQRLCDRIADKTERKKSTVESNLFSLPAHLYSSRSKEVAVLSRHLYRTAMDLVLLRRREWYGRWKSPLSPESRCLAVALVLHERGRHKEGERLSAAIAALTKKLEDVSLPLLELLAILSNTGDSIGEVEQSFVPKDSPYHYYSSSLFQYKSDDKEVTVNSFPSILDKPPGCGFSGFCSQAALTKDHLPQPSSLFGGLTHTTGFISAQLKPPPLTTPPNILHQLTQSPAKPHPMHHPLKDTPTHDDLDQSFISLISSVSSLDTPPPPIGWDGPLVRRESPYLSESGALGCTHSAALQGYHFPSLARVDLPSSPFPSHLPYLSESITDLQQLPTDHLPLFMSGDAMLQACGHALHSVTQFIQIKIDQQKSKGQSVLGLQCSLSALLPVIRSICRIAKEGKELSGIALLNLLFSLCEANDGLPGHNLVLAILRQTLTPYLHFLQKWTFEGRGRGRADYGLIASDDDLAKRDQCYWTRAFQYIKGGVPHCLGQYSDIILSTGKALNVLRLCCSNHPLCSFDYPTPTLELALSLSDLTVMETSCEGYHTLMEHLCQEQTERQRTERLQRELDRLQPIMEARRQALLEMEQQKEKEAELEEREMEKKRALFKQLRNQMEHDRALKAESAAEERALDRWMAREEEEKERREKDRDRATVEILREEMVDHYRRLSRRAEERRVRAVWRRKRFALSLERVQLMEKDRKEWDSLMNSGEAVPHLGDGEDERSARDLGDSLNNESPFNTDKSSLHSISVQEKPSPSILNTAELPNINSTTSVAEATASHKPHSSDNAPLDTIESPGVVKRRVEQNQLLPAQSCTDTRLKEKEEEHEMEEKQENLPDVSSAKQQLLTESGAEIEEKRGNRGGPPPTTIQHLMYRERYNNWTGEIVEEEVEVDQEKDATVFTAFAPYQDSFPILGEVPLSSLKLLAPSVSHLLPSSRSPISSISLSVLLERCVVQPILTQAHLVNEAVVQYLMEESEIMKHFIALKRFLLLEDGEFAHVLTTRLFEQLTYGRSLDILCSSSFLSSVLSAAMEYSPPSSGPSDDQLTLTVTHRPQLISTFSPKPLEFLRMNYKVDWPCNIVITEENMDNYNKVFHFLLQIKRAAWTLKNAFIKLSRGEGRMKFRHYHQRQLHAHRQELQHFVVVIENYVTNQLFHLSWDEFNTRLKSVCSVDELIQCHNEFIKIASFRCLLTEQSKPLMDVIQNILSTIMRFSSQLLSLNVKLTSLTHTHRTFRENTNLLVKVVQKLVERGYQPHLSEFLLRLNFNKFYK